MAERDDGEQSHAHYFRFGYFRTLSLVTGQLIMRYVISYAYAQMPETELAHARLFIMQMRLGDVAGAMHYIYELADAAEKMPRDDAARCRRLPHGRR